MSSLCAKKINVDDIRIYNRALTGEDFKLFQSTLFLFDFQDSH